MDLAKCGRQASGDMQEARQLERWTEDSIQGLAAGVLQHEQRPPLVASEGQRPHRPPGIQFGGEGVFVLEPVEACRCRPVRDGRPHQDRAGGVGRPAAVQGKLPASCSVSSTYPEISIPKPRSSFSPIGWTSPVNELVLSPVPCMGPSIELDQASLEGGGDGLRPVSDPHFGQNVVHVRLHRPFRDEQRAPTSRLVFPVAIRRSTSSSRSVSSGYITCSASLWATSCGRYRCPR
jgi:hypothetical protein